MGLNYFYKCNPKVAEKVGATPFDHFFWPDGTVLLWKNDLMKIDREAFFDDEAAFLADLGAVRMTDPEAAAEQKNPAIILPMARKEEYRWEYPDPDEEAISVEEAAEESAEAEETDSGEGMGDE